MKSFKILGLLLSYPEKDLMENLGLLMETLDQEALLPLRSRKKIAAFISELSAKDLYQAQEDYVELFDRGRSHCLHLFEHIHGESRDRGQAMVDLGEVYAKSGFYVSGGEMPDYLPMFLEYLSLIAADEAVSLLGETISILATIGARLKKRGAPYAVVFAALQSLSKVKVDPAIIEAALSEPEEDQSPEAIDKEWEEASAFDNGELAAADCGSCNAFPNASEELSRMTPDSSPDIGQHRLNGGF